MEGIKNMLRFSCNQIMQIIVKRIESISAYIFYSRFQKIYQNLQNLTSFYSGFPCLSNPPSCVASHSRFTPFTQINHPFISALFVLKIWSSQKLKPSWFCGYILRLLAKIFNKGINLLLFLLQYQERINIRCLNKRT